VINFLLKSSPKVLVFNICRALIFYLGTVKEEYIVTRSYYIKLARQGVGAFPTFADSIFRIRILLDGSFFEFFFSTSLVRFKNNIQGFTRITSLKAGGGFY